MTATVPNALLSALLSLSLVLPMTTAVLAGLGLADGRVLVICTGDGLHRIRIDENGEPVEISAEAELCALVHAAVTSDLAGPETKPSGLYQRLEGIEHSSVAPTGSRFSNSLPRAPPVG